MPRRCELDPFLSAILVGQDWVIHRDQALTLGFGVEAIKYRLRAGQWRRLLPEVYLTQPGEPSRRQMLIAALVYAGPDAAIDSVDACRFHGIQSIGSDARVHVVVPWRACARSTHFVVVRRTLAPITIVTTERLRFVDAATAVIAATRRMRSEDAVLAALSDALQRRIVTYDDLVYAHVQGPPRGARFADAALETLDAGTRSVPEAEFRRLVGMSVRLPPVEYNVWVKLQDGRIVCLDALIEESAVVHETNGRKAHAREDLFEDMQERHDAVTVAGFVVLHNSPRRIRGNGREVLAQVERCHEMYAGRGMPAGVVKIAPPG
jgi:hypothetical protein